MKIYSKFNDYYDHTGFYSDENKWVRKTRFESFKVNENDSYLTKYSNKTEDLLSKIADSCRLGCIKSGFSSADDEAILVGFCGKVYPAFLFYEFTDTKDNWRMSSSEKLKGCYIDISKFMSLRNDAGKAEPKDGWSFRRMTGRSLVGYEEFEYHEHKDLDCVFVELNSPIFIIRSGRLSPSRYEYAKSKTDYSECGNLIVNPCFSDFKLMSSFDPFFANQEIEMYLGNQLVARDSGNISLTDELMRDSKGFYDMSFRKRKC